MCGVFPDDEVGAVIKACITVAAQAEFVLVTLHITLVLSQFDSWSVAGACHNTGSNCRGRSGIPVDSRSGGGHRSSGVSDAGSTLCVKVFHFLDACSPPPPPPPPPAHPTPPHPAHSTQGDPEEGHPEEGSPRGGVIQSLGSSRTSQFGSHIYLIIIPARSAYRAKLISHSHCEISW